MELKLELNLKMNDTSKEKRKKVAQTKEKVKSANEMIEEAFDRIAEMSLTDKEKEQLEVAREAVRNGEAGRLESGKMNKGEALSIGARVMRKREDAKKAERIKSVIETQPENFHVLVHDSQIEPFMERLRLEVKLQKDQWKDRFKMLGVESLTANDFEGTGIDSYLDLSIGFSIWLPILNEGYYLAYGHVELPNDHTIPKEYAFKEGDPQLSRTKVLANISKYLGAAKHGKSFHMGSARYDLHIAENDGYTIDGCVWDTLDAMKIMTENLDSYGLKPLIQRYGKRFLGIHNEVFTFEDLFGKRSPAPFNTLIVGIYAIYDVYYGWKLTKWQFETMKKTDRLLDCYAEIDSYIPQVDVFMCRTGFNVDLEELKGLEKEFEAKVQKAIDAVFTSYNIDQQFLYDMSLTINGKKIQKWKETQHRKIDKKKEQLRKAVEAKEDCEANGKTHLKKYTNALDKIKKHKAELRELQRVLAEEDCDLFIKSFEFTNGNHIGYLIYDFLGIEDKTYIIQKGKTRSTAADVLKIYYEDEESLAPLATVAEYQTLLNTFVLKIPQAMEVDGRFHSEFKAGGTSTGRYSSAAYSGRPIDILDEFK